VGRRCLMVFNNFSIYGNMDSLYIENTWMEKLDWFKGTLETNGNQGPLPLNMEVSCKICHKPIRRHMLYNAYLCWCAVFLKNLLHLYGKHRYLFECESGIFGFFSRVRISVSVLLSQSNFLLVTVIVVFGWFCGDSKPHLLLLRWLVFFVGNLIWYPPIFCIFCSSCWGCK